MDNSRQVWTDGQRAADLDVADRPGLGVEVEPAGPVGLDHRTEVAGMYRAARDKRAGATEYFSMVVVEGVSEPV